MRVEVTLDGKTYVGVNDCSKTVEEMSRYLYEVLGTTTAFKLKLLNGEYLVIGKDACSRAVFIVCG
jgi:hypothetical protein